MKIDRLTAPDWVTAWYPNDTLGLRMAVLRYNTPVTTAAERTAATEFTLEPSTPCTGCGRFAFPQPQLCYWCRRVNHG